MEHKTISIRHKVIEAEVDGKFVPMGEDVLKTKSSFRTLPLIPAVGIILLEEKEKQEMYRRLFKKVTAGTTSTTSALTSAETSTPELCNGAFLVAHREVRASQGSLP